MATPRRKPLTIAELATATGLSQWTIRDYKRRGWDGDLTTLEEWRRATLSKSGPRPLLPHPDRRERSDQDPAAELAEGELERDWTTEFRRVTTLQALIELRARQGDLIRREDVERLWALRVAEVRAGLLLLPTALARRIANQPAEVVAEELEAEVRKILERYSRGDPILEGKPRKRGKGSRPKRKR